MKKIIAVLILVLLLVGCSPAPKTVNTDISSDDGGIHIVFAYPAPQVGTPLYVGVPSGCYRVVFSGDDKSMHPAFTAGHEGVLCPITDYSKIKIGDIIAFHYGSQNVAHQVISVEEDGVWTQGIIWLGKSRSEREFVPWSDIMGRIVLINYGRIE